MKAFLMFPDRDFDPDQRLLLVAKPSYARHDVEFDPWKVLPWNAKALAQDLELDTLFTAMAGQDEFLFEVSRNALLSAVTQKRDTILYRQEILKDCLSNPEIVRAMYALAVEAIEGERKKIGWWSREYPSGVLSHAVEVLQMFVDMLKRLRRVADEHSGKFASTGFSRLLAMLKAELGEDYFAEVQGHLRELRFRDGVLLSAELGKGNKGTNCVLRKPGERDRNWLTRIFSPGPPAYTLHIAPRDEAGARDLSELRDRGVSLVANALARSTEHILSFFNMPRTELAFYVACLNLHEQLARIGEPTCFPKPASSDRREFTCTGLYDVCLALSTKRKVVGNDLLADARELVVITGANQGGKSTFLRSVGLAQMMMQAGIFAPAESFSANIVDGVFTHYKREEDAAMESGKLDEELGRMSDIVDHLQRNAVVVFNESFAATNEREGSEIAGEIVNALIGKGVKVFFVTHMYELARGLHDQDAKSFLFLRAERGSDGRRTFKLVEGEPLRSSFGEDLYDRIFKPAEAA